MKNLFKKLIKRIKQKKNSKKFSLRFPVIHITPMMDMIPVRVKAQMHPRNFINKTFVSLVIIKVFCSNPFMFL